MEGLEERLVELGWGKANPEQVSEAIKFYNTPALFYLLEHELWLGEQFEGSLHRNQFWMDKNTRLFVDYPHDLLHIAGNLLSTTRSFVFGPTHTSEQSVRSDLLMLSCFLHEILNIYVGEGINQTGQVVMNEDVVISNKGVVDDVARLQAKAFDSYCATSTRKGIASARFKALAKDLVDFYMQNIYQEYNARDRQLAKFLKQNART